MKREDNIVYTTVDFIGMKKKKLLVEVMSEFNDKTSRKVYEIAIGDKITVEQPIALNREHLRLELGLDRLEEEIGKLPKIENELGKT